MKYSKKWLANTSDTAKLREGQPLLRLSVCLSWPVAMYNLLLAGWPVS